MDADRAAAAQRRPRTLRALVQRRAVRQIGHQGCANVAARSPAPAGTLEPIVAVLKKVFKNQYMTKSVANRRAVRGKSVGAPADADLYRLAARVGAELLRTQRTITTAESCTGGFVAKCLTDIAGSSAWFDRGVVTYGNASKVALLNVRDSTLRAYGAVSGETAAEMCRGALKSTGAQIAVSVTGIAGPGGAAPGKPVGTVWFGWAIRTGRRIQVVTAMERFAGARDAVRRQSVRRAFEGVLALIQ